MNHGPVRSLLGRRNVGLVLRVFASRPNDVSRRIGAVLNCIQKAFEFRTEARPVFSRCDVIVWSDRRYKDADCGDTAALIRAQVRHWRERVAVSDFTRGDLYCAALNYAVGRQLRGRVDYSLIMSTEAVGYLTLPNVGAMLDTMTVSNIRVSGLVMHEIAAAVQAGYVANTMALWDNLALVSAGLFDLRAAGIGAEEVIPLARLVEAYGQCIAPVVPVDAADQRYQVPHPTKNPALYVRYEEKMRTRSQRAAAHLASIGRDLSFLATGVHSEYRR